MKEVDVLVIGAGPTGLGAALRLEEHNVDSWLLCEQTDRPGGLAQTDLTPEGFYFDLGGHVIFSHYEYFDDVLQAAVGRFENDSAWVCLERECYIRYKDEWVPYPFQNNLYCIPKQDQVDCLLGLVKAKLSSVTSTSTATTAATPSNFDEWIVHTMGEGLARVFMRPYNFKVWATPCELMSSTWLGERVSVVDYERAISNTILEKRDAAWGPNAVFRFPKLSGGTGGIWQSVAENLLPQHKLEYNARLTALDAEGKLATFSNGTRVKYNKLLSTMPLDLLLDEVDKKKTDKAPAPAKELLVHSSTNVLGFGVRGSNPHGLKCWLYFPEDNCPFYRATVFSNYSPNNTPASDVRLPTLQRADGGAGGSGEAALPGPYFSLMLEVSESSEHKPVDQAALVQDTLLGCIRAGLLREGDEIVSIYHKRLEHGYPTPSLRRDEALNQLLPKLQANHQIWSRGRFGCWKYEAGNQDHSLIIGVEAVDNMMMSVAGGGGGQGGNEAGEESTMNRPNAINGRGKNAWPKYSGRSSRRAFQVAGSWFPTEVIWLQGKKFATVEEYVSAVVDVGVA